MCLSIFYAQVVGLWLFIIGLATVLHEQRFKKTMADTLASGSVMTFTGFIALAVGLLVVISHNIWVTSWPVVITIFGWLLLVQGVMRLFYPEVFAKRMKDMMAKNGFTVMAWVWLLVGLYLVWIGFAA